MGASSTLENVVVALTMTALPVWDILCCSSQALSLRVVCAELTAAEPIMPQAEECSNSTTISVVIIFIILFPVFCIVG